MNNIDRQFYIRELSSQERKDLYDKSNYSKDIFPTDEKGWNQLFDGYNIPNYQINGDVKINVIKK